MDQGPEGRGEGGGGASLLLAIVPRSCRDYVVYAVYVCVRVQVQRALCMCARVCVAMEAVWSFILQACVLACMKHTPEGGGEGGMREWVCFRGCLNVYVFKLRSTERSPVGGSTLTAAEEGGRE